MRMAKFMGDLAADVKIFPVLLIVLAWVVIPGGLLALSMAGVVAVAMIGGFFLASALLVMAVVVMRSFWM